MKGFKLKLRGMRLFHRHLLWLWFVLSIAVVLVLWATIPVFHHAAILATSVTAVCGAFYFLSQQHLEQARFFKELVTEFNRRYDEKNDILLSILDHKDDLTQEQKQAIIDYFNLCAEEYLFYEVGYIYECVWDAWYNGMKQFGQDHRVAKLWQKEIETDSYYGFEFPIDGKNKLNCSSGAKSTPTVPGQ